MANIFERELSKSFKILGWKHCGKLAVIRHKQPYDFWAVVSGIHYGLEAKSTAGGRPFPFNRLEAHQKEGLLELEEEGGVGWVLLSFRKSTKSQLCAAGIRIQDYIKLEKESLADNNKSIPASTNFLDKNVFVDIPRIRVEYLDPETNKQTKQLIWDMRVLLPKEVQNQPRFANIKGETTCQKPTKSNRQTTGLRSSSSKRKAKRSPKVA